MKIFMFLLFFLAGPSCFSLTKEEKVDFIKTDINDQTKRAAVITYLFKKSISNPDTPEPYLDEIITVLNSVSGTVTP